jgi:hypothetical protein
LPESLTRRTRPSDLCTPNEVAGITSERWPVSNRNDGRLQIGIPAGITVGIPGRNASESAGKGPLGITLRYPYEVRKEEEYFHDITDEKIPKDMLDLACHIVETKSGHFKPEKFEDHYEDALKELLRR